MNIYKARQLNAVKWAKAVNAVLDAGGIVLDKGGVPVKPFVVREDGDVIEPYVSSNCTVNVSYFINNPNYDNGCHTKIADFDKKFEGWKFIHPKDVKPLKKA